MMSIVSWNEIFRLVKDLYFVFGFVTTYNFPFKWICIWHWKGRKETFALIAEREFEVRVKNERKHVIEEWKSCVHFYSIDKMKLLINFLRPFLTIIY